MNSFNRYALRLFFSPMEHGGSNVKGGRPQGDPEDSGAEQIQDALGQPVPGDAKTAGTGDPGTPGSKTNPVKGEPEPEDDIDRGPTGVGTAGGS